MSETGLGTVFPRQGSYRLALSNPTFTSRLSSRRPRLPTAPAERAAGDLRTVARPLAGLSFSSAFRAFGINTVLVALMTRW